ncbi:MAG: DUF1176 domain-containing protein [Geminocystis sp. GBBB08]|nr:DUF1176 domain-containing protein [Geminocystis sp. GBBB08]
MSNFSFKIINFIVYGLIISLFSCQKLVKKSEQLAIITPEKKQKIINKIYAQQKTLNLCNQERDKALSKDSANIYLLNKQQYLVEILCFLGAYQNNYQYLLLNNLSSEIKIIDFVTFDSNSDKLRLTNTNILNGTAEFDSLSQTLILETKTRSLGDCGSFVKYQWQNSAFVLKEYRHKPNCDQVFIPPENYPLIYP